MQLDIDYVANSITKGEPANIGVPALERDEKLVILSGKYGGQICSPSPLSEKVAVEISTKYGSSVSALSFILLVSGDKIVYGLPLDKVSVLPEERGKSLCALIVSANNRVIKMECVPANSNDCEPAIRAVE